MVRKLSFAQRHPFLWVTIPLLVFVGCALYVWMLPPDDWLSIENWFRSIEAIRHEPLAPVYLGAAVLVASLFFIPVSGLILAAALVFQNLVGFVATMLALLMSAAIVHSVGRLAHKKIFAPPARVEKMRRFFSKRGVMSVVVIRILPVAPFHLVNFAAGYFSISLRTFILGSFLGLLPVTILVFLFTKLWREVIKRALTENTVLFVALVAVLLAIAIWTLVRRTRRTKD